MTEYDSFVSKIGDISIPTVDDVVDYRVYIWPLPGSVSAYHERLQDITTYLNEEIIKDYIWQDEPFSLTLVEGLESSSLEPAVPLTKDSVVSSHACHFFGSTRFGDNIDDEWFIVHILQCLSRRYGDVYSRYDILVARLGLNDSFFPSFAFHCGSHANLTLSSLVSQRCR